MKNILVPFDFSEESNYALNAAKSMAKVANSEITILHVIDDPNINLLKVTGEEHFEPIDALFVKRYREVVIKKLDAVLASDSNSEVLISYKIDIGNAFSSISEHVANHGSDLIVMGTKGVSGLKDILVGSITEKVVRYANCPVIVVKGKADLSDIKNIVFASDLHDDQEQIIAGLKTMQKTFGATLHLVKVYDSNRTSPGEIKEEAQKFIEKHDIENCTIAVERASDFSDAIMDYAASHNADIIAMGSHHRHGLFHLLAQHVAKDLVNHAHRPIWTMSIK